MGLYSTTTGFDDALDSWRGRESVASSPKRQRVSNSRTGGAAMIRTKYGALDVRRVKRTVERVLRHVVGPNDPEYEDLVQSCLENVLLAIRADRFRGDCPLERWVATIARNIAIDSLRARSRDRRVFSREEEEDFLVDQSTAIERPDHLTEIRQDLLDIESVLSDLGSAKARVVYLHDVLGYEIAEVSTLIGTSHAAAQKRLVRGRREIMERLTEATVSKKKHDYLFGRTLFPEAQQSVSKAKRHRRMSK